MYFSFLAVLMVLCSSAFALRMSNSHNRFVRSIKMSDAAPESEWTGAKKFSMKDRYTKTILSSDQINKILPHRYPFLLVDRVGKPRLSVFNTSFTSFSIFFPNDKIFSF